MSGEFKCLAYNWLTCEGDGEQTCFNDSCIRTGKCHSAVHTSADTQARCSLDPHQKDVKHYVELKEYMGPTMVEYRWKKREDPFDARTVDCE